MAKILSQEEIDALLSSVSESTVTNTEQAQKQKVTVYDFKHPNLISKEQMRLLEAIHENLCRNFSVFLSAQLRMIVEMNLLAIDQIMYSEFVMSIAPPSCLYVCNVDTPASHFVLELSPQLAIFVVERLFGGPGSPVTNIRPISVIEQKVMTRVINKFLEELAKSWELVTQFKADIQRYESNPEFVQIVPSSEPVVVVSMEVKIHGHATLLNISYPYMWVSSIISSPEVQEKILYGSTEATENEQKIIQESLMQTPTVINVRLGKSRISIKDFLDLQVGDVIQLEDRTDKLLPVYINNKHAFNGVVGLRKNHYAVRIESIEEGGEKNE
ncbi:flagellar motor switch protein FliM [candidate division KSB1 bacterium]|nr:MAG: flagellar motor switch protein FliM [candidate division KSB1 bacterium]